MAVEILWDTEKQVAAMYCTTSDHAFGPVFSGPSANVEVGEFLDWLHELHAGADAREIPAAVLEKLVREWCELPTVEGHRA